MKKALSFIGLCIAALVPVFADYARSGIPDSTEIRAQLVQSWFTAPVQDVRLKAPEILKDGIGNEFQVRAEDADGETAIIVAPKTLINFKYQNGESSYTEQTSRYSKTSPGSWILYRNSKTGKPLRVRLYFNNDSDVYVEFRDNTPKLYADMIVCNSYVARSIPVGFSLKKLYTTSFDSVVRMTERSLPWWQVTVVPRQYHSVLQMANLIRGYLRKMYYQEDACYNENEELYCITLNEPFRANTKDAEKNAAIDAAVATAERNGKLVLSGPGFLKWIVDGIVKNTMGRNTKVDDLVVPTVNYNSLGKNGVISQNWNLSFTLDWCRNLAVEALNARSSKRQYTYTMGAKDNTGVDVRLSPFVADIENGRILQSTGYSIDTGYSLRELKGLLYILAVTEPRHFYLAAIKQHSVEKPENASFTNCAVIFPYFDDTGSFDCIIYEMGKELSLAEFLKSHSDSFIHLERVEATDYFSPMIK
ncbi:MAG: hypothetical protein IJ828_10765 [Treponema sp.]|nr:hypothetical protein [Treponema sp.]